ncbi:cellulose synthase-like protein E6 [Panicum miliaceum]|uniref:Cellulose synthase-like protein E6 n=1 Tax=Panicum miliaceum TaxID=4540 RepID=A0A3L6QPL5_PANMI|nr:cellulose synthase-like protein E6 [Panicum miliaceum]
MERLFATEKAGGRALYKLHAVTVFAGICLVLYYRATHVPAAGAGRAAWGCWRRSCGSASTGSSRSPYAAPSRTGSPPDPQSEPPSLVMATVLSLMAYNYPPDDGGSILTFYALWETSAFAKRWLPFCRRYNIRSPAAYFAESDEPNDPRALEEWSFVKILIDGKDRGAVDNDGNVLPTLVYMAREKRPQYHHNFKAGAMNALIRVSSVISKSPIIMNVDCDMYSNNSDSIREALCFFLDEEMGHKIAFVQYPQNYNNMTKNNIYGNSLNAINQVELAGMDTWGGPLYIGTGCFHRRETLCGRSFNKDYKEDWDQGIKTQQRIDQTEEKAKSLATCTYEHNTQWGNEIGLKYGCPVEDVITGLAIHCRGWESVYNNPPRAAFVGVAPTTMAQTIFQHKRWSKVLPLLLWTWKNKVTASNGLLHIWFMGTPLFPEIMSPWITPFIYVTVVKNIYSLYEALTSGDTLGGWWNGQRMWLVKRITSYLYGVIDNIRKLLGLSKMGFVVSPKVSDEDESKRYEQEIMEFGTSSPEYVIIATIALLNLVCLVGGLGQILTSGQNMLLNGLFLQVVLCGLLVIINIPIYEAMFLRKDRGRTPFSVTLASVGFVMMALFVPIF